MARSAKRDELMVAADGAVERVNVMTRSARQAVRLCFVGYMAGREPGQITSQGYVLSGLFEAAGYPVVATSAQANRYRRLLDILLTLVRRRADFDLAVLEIYHGRSFLLEDLASWLCQRLGKPVVFWLHGGALPEYLERFPRWTRRVFNRAAAFVAPSPFLARTLTGQRLQARVIPNVLDLQTYSFQPRRRVHPRLFWMRSFHPIWNPEMALRVLARLREDGLPEATLVMAGKDKGWETEIHRLAESLGLGEAVVFPGFLDEAGKTRAGQNTDIFINTNRVDNMPVSVLEACAMGLPVVATTVGGIPDLLTDGETGLLVPPEDDAAMAEAIKRVVANTELACRLSLNGRRLAERSAWEQVRPQWEQLFSEIIPAGGEA